MKTRYKGIRALVFIVLLPFLIQSCELDPTKDGKLEEEDIWQNSKRAFGYLNDTYSNIPTGYNRIDAAMLASGSDESVNSEVRSRIVGFNNGKWSQYYTIDDAWSNNYAGIRKVNTFLSKINDVPITSTVSGSVIETTRTRDRMIGEAHFLRALFYFELVKRYGGVPLTTAVLSPEEATNATRASLDDCIAQIVEDCKLAEEQLPLEYLKTGFTPGFNELGSIGRATIGAAKALKARVLLYWASPLNNPSNDLSRWEDAATAAQAVITLNVYRLIPFKADESVGDISFITSGGSFGMYNADIVFATRYNASNSFERSNTPSSFGGYGYTNPSQNLVNAFGMKDGKAINAPSSSYDAQNPYANRDPRFYMTVAHNGIKIAVNDKNEVLETFVDGKDATGQYITSTKTGYYLNKMISKNAVWDGRTSNVSRTWAIIRYAEVLLNYAEALNEWKSTPAEEVYIALEDIRKRAGLNPYTIDRGKTQTEMRKMIRNERQIELAFEEHRFFDTRRWKLFDDPIEKDNLLNIKGMKIVKNVDNSLSYTEIPVEQRTFSKKMYLFPIPNSEILKATGITQNPDW